MKKVFCIGFHKTGTNSLGTALEHLGYRVCGVQFELLPSLERKDFVQLIEIANSYDAFKDNPWPLLYKELDVLFPGSKFIFTIRDDKKWIRSVVNHFNSTPSEMLQHVYGKPYPEGNEKLYLDTYRNHNQDVVTYFAGRTNDFLILDLESETAWQDLCAFLHKPVPDIPFPFINKGAYSVFEKLSRKINRLKRGLMRRLGL